MKNFKQDLLIFVNNKMFVMAFTALFMIFIWGILLSLTKSFVNLDVYNMLNKHYIAFPFIIYTNLFLIKLNDFLAKKYDFKFTSLNFKGREDIFAIFIVINILWGVMIGLLIS